MKNVCLGLVVASFLALGGLPCRAQETLVPIDGQGKVNVIDRATEAKLGLFPEYEGFDSARLFQSSDTSFVLEIYYQPADKVQKISVDLTADEARLLRARVSAAIRAKAPGVALDQSGRTAFLLGTAALSLGYYGWVVPYVMDLDSPEAYTAAYLLTTGAGFFGPFLLTRNRSVTDGAATLSLYGGTRGIFHGRAIGTLVEGDLDFREWATASMVTSLSEYAVGFVVASRSNMGAGTAEAIGALGDLGYALGLGTAFVTDMDDDRLEAGTVLLSSGLGLWGGHVLARKQHYTRGDAFVLRAATSVVAYDALAAIALTNDHSKPAVIGAMCGGVAGTGLGHWLVKAKDFTTGQGVLINVGEFTGALLGVGVAVIASDDDDWYLAASALGATGGFWLTYYSLAGRAETHGKDSSWNFEVYPQALLALRSGRTARVSSKVMVPLLRFQYRF